MLKVAILSDTHGVLDPRIAELVQGCDQAVHAGDIGNATVLELLRPRGGQVAAVRGNNDLPSKWPADHRPLLDTLPERTVLTLPGGLLAVDHGHRAVPVARRHEILRKRYPRARAVVYGHSHRLLVDREREHWVLNGYGAGARALLTRAPTHSKRGAISSAQRGDRGPFPPDAAPAIPRFGKIPVVTIATLSPETYRRYNSAAHGWCAQAIGSR
jgi:putative phosphoesterase